MWALAGPGIEPVSLALQGRLLTTGPPGKPSASFVSVFVSVSLSLSIFLKHRRISLPFSIPSAFFFFPNFFHLFYNWRIIALQCGVDFCCATRISHNYIYIYIHIYSLSLEPRSPPPFHTSGLSGALGCVPCVNQLSYLSHMVQKGCPRPCNITCFQEGGP